MSKRLSLSTTAVLFRTTFTPGIKLNLLLKIRNVGDARSGSDAINMNFYNNRAPFGNRDANQNFNCRQKTLYNDYISGNDSEVIIVKWAKDRFLPLASSVAMSGNLQVRNY